MANQLKTKFIGNDQVKGEKVLLDNNSALRAKDSSGTAQEMMKLDATDKVIVYRSTGAEEIAYISDVNSGGTALQDHIDDPTDAHDASAISVVPTGNLAASDVQAALEELQGDLDGIDATYVNAAGDTMTGNLTIDDGMESTVYQTSGISANQALTLDSMGSTGDITLSAANVYMAGSLKNNSSGTGYISIDSPSGSVDLQGGGSEINIETAN
jgi:hypothetical protein